MRTVRRRSGARGAAGREDGFVLPAVLGAVLLTMLLVAVMSTVVLHAGRAARGEAAAAQARASAEAGVAEALAEIARASTKTNGSLPTGVYQCSFDVNEYNHPGAGKGFEFYYVDLRYGAQLPNNAPSPSSCQPRGGDRLTAANPAPGTITLVAQGVADYGRQALFTPSNAATGYNQHAVDVVLTNTGSKSSPVWEVTSWRDRG